MSTLAPAGVYVWGRQEPWEKPAILLREHEPLPSAYNRDRLKPAPGARKNIGNLYAAHRDSSARRKLRPDSSVGASAVYVPPVAFKPADFNQSNKHAFPRRQRALAEDIRLNPYAGMRVRTKDSAVAYVDLGQADDAGAYGPAHTTDDAHSARMLGRISLEDIGASAKAMGDSVSNAAFRTQLAEIRSKAIGLHTIAMQRPLSEDEDRLWLDLSTALSSLAIEVSQFMGTGGATGTAPAVSSSAPPTISLGGPPAPTPGPPIMSIKAPAPIGPAPAPIGPSPAPGYTPPQAQQMKDTVDRFLNPGGQLENMYKNKNVDVKLITNQIVGPLAIPDIRVSVNDPQNVIHTYGNGAWKKGGVFQYLRRQVRTAPDIATQYNRVIEILAAFANAGITPAPTP